MREKRKQKMDFAEASLLVSLYNQEEGVTVKNHPDSRGMFRSADFASKVVGFLKQKGEISVAGEGLFLTEKGRERARITMEGKVIPG